MKDVFLTALRVLRRGPTILGPYRRALAQMRASTALAMVDNSG